MPDWLLAVDLQPAFSHPDSPWFTPGLADVIPRIAALAEAFAGQAVFSRFVPPAQPFGSWHAYYERWPFALAPEAAWLWELDEPWRGRPSVASHRMSKWLPSLAPRCADGSAAVLCGVATDCCVLMTALEALDDGATVRVVTDACAAKTLEDHARALALLASRAPQLTLTTTAEELARR